MEQLASTKCGPDKDAKPLAKLEAEEIPTAPSRKLVDDPIEKEFKFRSYLAGLDFVRQVGKIAQEQDHYLDILIRWKRVKLSFPPPRSGV